jgi:hypothetical protein
MMQAGGQTSQGGGHMQALPSKDSEIDWSRSEDMFKAGLSALANGCDIMEEDAPARHIGDSPYVFSVLSFLQWYWRSGSCRSTDHLEFIIDVDLSLCCVSPLVRVLRVRVAITTRGTWRSSGVRWYSTLLWKGSKCRKRMGLQ